jgi:transcription elongation factor Elf1
MSIPIKCSYCGEEMISNADMKKHYEKHQQIKCENCENVFTSEKEHELHLKLDHAIKDSKKT